MKLILSKDVTNLGRAGEVVTVADGYARNYLIPKRLAVLAEKGSLKHLDGIASIAKRKEDKVRSDADALGRRLTSEPLVIEAHSGRDTTKLFGSVTSGDIAEALKARHGVEVDRRTLQLKEPIKALGEYMVPIRLHTSVIPSVTVRVMTKEQIEAANAPAEPPPALVEEPAPVGEPVAVEAPAASEDA